MDLPEKRAKHRAELIATLKRQARSVGEPSLRDAVHALETELGPELRLVLKPSLGVVRCPEHGMVVNLHDQSASSPDWGCAPCGLHFADQEAYTGGDGVGCPYCWERCDIPETCDHWWHREESMLPSCPGCKQG